MNYIKHLTAFYEKISSEHRLNPSHVSLYMALFQFWNLNRFENPISINREQAMKYSKIGSTHTYHKCLYDLHNLGYIVYQPSYNHFRGSLVYLCIFDTSDAQDVHRFSSKNDTGTAQELLPSINSINIINNKTEREENTSPVPPLKGRSTPPCPPQLGRGLTHSQNKDLIIMKNQRTVFVNSQKGKRKKVAQKKEKPKIPPTLNQVLAYFKTENYPELEGKKFFNHFESNGWRVGGKSPMKDWQAAARKWMLNVEGFLSVTKTGLIKTNTSKRYDVPL